MAARAGISAVAQAHLGGEDDGHRESRRAGSCGVSRFGSLVELSEEMYWNLAWHQVRMEADPTQVFVGWFPHLDRSVVSLNHYFWGCR